jgi:hypothetical protein
VGRSRRFGNAGGGKSQERDKKSIWLP